MKNENLSKRMKELWSNPQYRLRLRQAHLGKHKGKRTTSWKHRIGESIKEWWVKRKEDGWTMPSGDKHPAWKGGSFIFFSYEAKKTWEDYWNQVIPEGYNIHHIDCNHTNNDITNLVALPVAEHNRIHCMKRFKYVDPIKRLIVCYQCGKTRKHHARNMCAPCYKRLWYQNLIILEKQQENL